MCFNTGFSTHFVVAASFHVPATCSLLLKKIIEYWCSMQVYVAALDQFHGVTHQI